MRCTLNCCFQRSVFCVTLQLFTPYAPRSRIIPLRFGKQWIRPDESAPPKPQAVLCGACLLGVFTPKTPQKFRWNFCKARLRRTTFTNVCGYGLRFILELLHVWLMSKNLFAALMSADKILRRLRCGFVIDCLNLGHNSIIRLS